MKVFHTKRVKAAACAFCHYENTATAYPEIDSHEALTRIGGYQTVVAVEQGEIGLSYFPVIWYAA